MLETTNPFMFTSTSSNNTTTNTGTVTVTRQNTIEQLTNGKGQQRPLHNYYLTNEEGEEGERQSEYQSMKIHTKSKYTTATSSSSHHIIHTTSNKNKSAYQGKTPIRLNSAFIQHGDNYIYKSLSNNYHQRYTINTNSLKDDMYSNILLPPPPIPSFPISIQDNVMPSIRSTELDEDNWYEESAVDSVLDSSDNRKVKRRKEMTVRMERLNMEFIESKDSIYSDKLVSIESEIKDAHHDTHSAYLDGLRDLESMRKKTIGDGLLFKEYQKQVTDNQFSLEIYQAEEEYTAETHEVREKLFSILEEKRKKLKEDKDNCDLTYDIVLESQSRLHKRNLRKRRPENLENKTNKRKQLNGPTLVLKLKEEDINADILAMKNVGCVTFIITTD
ncbi:Sds3-like-domain-containing protein [Pilobolus umbonatus]|nr:Sds3-like-domain-containing protein [Pilobolus umbonatus]